MTDQQAPTLCPRCGGHLDRCECAAIRRAAFNEILALMKTSEDGDWDFLEFQIRELARLPPAV